MSILTCACGTMHPAEFSTVVDRDGCIKPIGHVGPHEFVSRSGVVYLWEDAVCDDCDCDLEMGECCTVYWRKDRLESLESRDG